MNAVVDDLTNYLGPDPNASGDGGFTKVYQATAGQTWTLQPTLLMDMTFGFGRQDQHVSGPTSRPATSASTCSASPAPTIRAPATRATPGIRSSTSPRFSAVGNRDGWNPIFRDERTYSTVDERHEDEGTARHPWRLSDELPLSRSLAAGNRQPARRVRLQRRHVPALRRRPADEQLLQRSSRRSCSAWSARQQERAERADDGARVAARALRPRPLDANTEADVRPRAAVGALPDHASRRRPRPRSARPDQPRFHTSARRAHRRPRRQPAEQRHER